MAKPSDIADICQASAQVAEAALPTDSALDDLIGYAMR
ncbi:MarR family transcriptional regulator, partial [Pseudomonas savastanoi pv. glycinea str. race 4]